MTKFGMKNFRPTEISLCFAPQNLQIGQLKSQNCNSFYHNLRMGQVSWRRAMEPVGSVEPSR